MQEMEPFTSASLAPSWWANAIQKAVSLLANNFQVTLQDATHIQVVAGADDQAAVIAITGKWRWNEATVVRAHPGGAAGTYDIYVTAADNSISTDLRTDSTVYAFALAIEPAGTTPPIVAGTVDIFRKVGTLQWSGSAITRIDQSVPGVSLHAHKHATGGPDPLAPADIGAASTADLATETSRAETAETNIPTAGQKAALAGTSGTPGAANAYVTSADGRNSNSRAPTGAAGGDLGSTYPNPTVVNINGRAVSAVVFTDDARLSNARAPTAHKATHEPGGSDPLTLLTDASVAAANKDGAFGLPSLRSLTAAGALYLTGRALAGNAAMKLADADDVFFFLAHVSAAGAIVKAFGAPPGLAVLGNQAGPGGYRFTWTAGSHPNTNVGGIAIGTQAGNNSGIAVVTNTGANAITFVFYLASNLTGATIANEFYALVWGG